MRHLSITQLKEKIVKKEVSCVELAKMYLESINAHKHLNAFITVDEKKTLAMAHASDERVAKGTARPLEGVPIAIKDLFCTKDVLTTAGSKILSNFVPFYESSVTNNLWNNGAVMLGKTNMDEFAMGSTTTTSYYGPTINPWRRKSDPSKDLVPGGSSGGSAAAVAAKIAPGALGSDTGGSIRQPASFCGIVGIKPTYGLCSRFGMVAFASSLDQAGVFTQTVKDAALLLENIAGYDPNDSTSLKVDIPKYSKHINPNVKGKRIVVFKEFFKGLNEEGTELLKKAIKWFEEEGARVEEIDFPMLEYALPVYYVIAPAEASSNLARYDGVRYGVREQADAIDEMISLSRGKGFGPEVRRRILTGTYVLSSAHYDAYYIRAQKIRQMMSQAFDEVFKTYDAVLSLTTPTAAFALDEEPESPQELYLNDIYTVIANLVNLPSISVPCSLSKEGLPLGLQLMSPRLSEQNLFNLAQFIENKAILMNS